MTLDQAAKVKNTEIAKELVRLYHWDIVFDIADMFLVLATSQASLQYACRGRDQVGHQQLLQEKPGREDHQSCGDGRQA